jgi:hypothetical protein
MEPKKSFFPENQEIMRKKSLCSPCTHANYSPSAKPSPKQALPQDERHQGRSPKRNFRHPLGGFPAEVVEAARRHGSHPKHAAPHCSFSMESRP